MAKSLMNTVGGGKVTVAGLTPDVLLAGHTVTVKQGSKITEQVQGEAPLFLAIGGYTQDTNRQLGVISNVEIEDFAGFHIMPGVPQNIANKNPMRFVAPLNGRYTSVAGFFADNGCSPNPFNKGDTVSLTSSSGKGGGYFAVIKFED